jgi:hypothetical protein
VATLTEVRELLRKQRLFHENNVIEMLIRLVSLLYFKSIQSAANVLRNSTHQGDSPEQLLQKLRKVLQQEDSLDELFDRNLKTESKFNEKTIGSLQKGPREKWEKGRLNIQRYIFHKLKGVFELLFEVLHLSIFDNCLYSLSFFAQADLFLNLLVFFPDPVFTLLAEMTKNVGKVSFFDSRFSTDQHSPSFDLDTLILKEGHLFHSKLLSFRNGFFELSNQFINQSYNIKTKKHELNHISSKTKNIEFPHITE